MKLRESWGSHLGFLMATAGSAVGLGSLWKFPYVTGENGGGIFVLAYLLFTFIIGVPIFIAELIVGRKAERSPVDAFGELPPVQRNWSLLGWSCSLSAFLILSYYIVVAGWTVNYAFLSLLNFTKGKTSAEISGVFDVLYKSADINLFWTTLFLLFTLGIVYKGVRKGIEFWSKVLMPLLFAILIILFLYSMTLSGFGEAFSFIFKPDVSKFKPSGLLEALGLACFTLSVGMGVLVTYGSYMRKSEDIPKTAVTVASIDIFVSLLASLMIFPIIFTFNFAPTEGTGLLFKAMPALFAKLPGTIILSTIFFLLVVFAALTSAISVMEVLVATAMEKFGWSREKSAGIVGAATLILAIPSALSGSETLFHNWPLMFGKNFFETIDYFSFTWLLPINAALMALFAGWAIEKSSWKQEWVQGTRWHWIFNPWIFLIRWVVPVGVLLIMLQQGGIINIDKFFLKG